MKAKNKKKVILNRIKNSLDKNVDRIGHFIRATIEQKPLLSLFTGLENMVDDTLKKFENKVKRRKVKIKEKKIQKQQFEIFEDEIPQHIFLERLEELKKQLPIKQLEKQSELKY